MNNNCGISGWNCRLRPVCVDDAKFLVGLRNQPFTSGFIHSTPTFISVQEEWIRVHAGRNDDYYWIIENTTQRRDVGAVGLYDLIGNEGMLGRWVMVPNADMVIAVPITLVYQFAFETLGLSRVVFDVVESNHKVIKFHNLYGARSIECPARYLGANPEFRFVWYEITQEMWPSLKLKWNDLLGAES